MASALRLLAMKKQAEREAEAASHYFSSESQTCPAGFKPQWGSGLGRLQNASGLGPCGNLGAAPVAVITPAYSLLGDELRLELQVGFETVEKSLKGCVQAEFLKLLGQLREVSSAVQLLGCPTVGRPVDEGSDVGPEEKFERRTTEMTEVTSHPGTGDSHDVLFSILGHSSEDDLDIFKKPVLRSAVVGLGDEEDDETARNEKASHSAHAQNHKQTSPEEMGETEDAARKAWRSTSQNDIGNTRKSARQSDSATSYGLAKFRREQKKEMEWLMDVRRSCTKDSYSNKAQDYDDLEEWRNARRGWYHRCELYLWEKMTRTTSDVRFDYVSAFFIVLNSICVGVNTDFTAKNIGAAQPLPFRVFDLIFCVIFTVELVMKLFVHRKNFYWLEAWKWNCFDTLLVGMQLFEEVLTVLMDMLGGGGGGAGMNFSFMRVLRVLRLVRIIRLFRVLRVIGELRTIVASIAGCMKPLFSALILLVLMIYVVGVFFTQAVSTYFLENADIEHDEALVANFGTLAQSLFSLFQAILGGMDWGDMANPLVTHLSATYGIIFAAYIIFAVLAMMNVMTGVFVEAALNIAKADEDAYMVTHMKNLLKVTDQDESGSISWEEFEEQLDNPDMVEYFKCIDVDISEGRSLFDILDPEAEGQVEAEAFVSGCLRLRGPARALDLEILSNLTRKAGVKTFSLLHRVENLCLHLAKHAPRPEKQQKGKAKVAGKTQNSECP
jgi:hypothetical protein